MKFTTEKIETIRDMLYLPCKIISGDVPISFSKTGISVCAMDLSHVCLVICDIPAPMFSKIEVEKDYQATFNSVDLIKILTKIKKSDLATIEINDNKMIIKQTAGKKVSRWSLKMVDSIEKEPPNIEHILATEHETKLQINVASIKEALSNLEIFDTKSAIFSTSNSTLKISSGETNIGDYELIVEKNELPEFESSTDSIGMFSTDYLKTMCEIEKLSNQVLLEYSTDAFLLLKSISDEFKLWIMLACRTEDEVEEYDE